MTSQSISLGNGDGYISPAVPSSVGNGQPENIDDQDSSIKKTDDLFKAFRLLSEDQQRQVLGQGMKILQMQSAAFDSFEKQAEDNHAAMDSLGRALMRIYEPGGFLDPARLEEQKKVTEQQKKDLEQQKKDLEQHKKDREEIRKEEEARRAKLDKFKYIIELKWLYDGARLVKDVAYDNRETILKVGLLAGAVFFLHLVTDNYQAILQYKITLLPPTCFGIVAQWRRHSMLIKERTHTHSEPNFKE